jgi:hypothetical protein
MRKHPAPGPENQTILLRALAEPAKSSRKGKRPQPPKGALLESSDWSLVFDCETTTDPGQALRFGFCRVYFREDLRREVCFYRTGRVLKSEVSLIKAYAEAVGVEVMPCDEFIDKIFYKYGYHLRAMLIGFNLPFDLSRLAIGYSAAHPTKRDRSMYGGFSLKLSPFPYCRKHPVRTAVAALNEVRSTSCISFLSHTDRDHCGRPFSPGRKTSAGRYLAWVGNWQTASH